MPPRPPVLSKQRQPLCPYCEYNLTGVFDRAAMRSVRCPECGEVMEAHEVGWTRREGDWTLALGLRRAAVFFLVRGLLVAIVLTGSVLLAEFLRQNNIMFWIPAILQIIIGVGCAKVLFTGLEDAIGFYGLPLPALSTLVMIVIAIVVATIVAAIPALAGAPIHRIMFLTGTAATITIVIDYMTEAA